MDENAMDAQEGEAPGEVGLSAAARRAVGTGAALMVLLGALLLLLLVLAAHNQLSYGHNYPWLLAANVLAAAVLLGVVLWGGVRLWQGLRRGLFGARLLLKLSAIFALVGLAPGVLIYTVSYQFVSHSMEIWFDARVERALVAGLELADTTLQTVAGDMANNTWLAAMQLSGASDAAAALMVARIREQLGARDLVLWSAGDGARRSGTEGLRAIASAGRSRFALHPPAPERAMLRALRQQRAVHRVEGLEDGGRNEGGDRGLDATPPRVHTLALVPGPGLGVVLPRRYLQATLDVPPALLDNARAVRLAHDEYRERARSRDGLRRMYIGTLTLSLLLAVCGAVMLAIVLGNQLARPLLLLAEGMRAVARGDLRPRGVLRAGDEISGLTRSFALMTRQLSDARREAQHNMARLDAARTQLQTILDNLSSGVIVLDAFGRMVLGNPGAARILRTELAPWLGRDLRRVPGLEALGTLVEEQFAQLLGALQASRHWQQTLVLRAGDTGDEGDGPARDGAAEMPGHDITLMLRGARLADAQRLVVLEDISEVVSAQRTRAWGDVARRVAHEIKNPLTPIQLSAERMGLRLMDKLPPPEQALLAKSVKTIVEQVSAMKNLVDEFRAFARLPAARLESLDLNALVLDVLHLYGQQPVAHSLDARCPPIAGDRDQLRQVLHNLLQNALDASSGREGAGQEAPVQVQTRWSEGSARVLLSVRDAGCGFAEHILQRAFEPYVTTKARGTGLGLAVVKKIADEHGARIQLANLPGADGQVQGAQVSLSFAPEGAGPA